MWWKLIVERGPGIAFWLLALAAQMSGYTSTAIALGLVGAAAFFLIAPACHHIRKWHLQRKALGKTVLGTAQVLLLVGLVGTWFFMTISLGAAAWMVWNGQGFGVASDGRAGAD